MSWQTIGDRVIVRSPRPKGYTVREWSQYAGKRGVIEHLSVIPGDPAPILVRFEDGDARWFRLDELDDGTEA